MKLNQIINKWPLFVIILCSLIGLVGCQKDPMIRLSEETQASLLAKQETSTDPIDESEKTDSSSESSIKEEEPSENDATQTVEQTLMTQRPFDPETLTPLEAVDALVVSDYLPVEAYQLREYPTAQGVAVEYVDYLDEVNQLAQIHQMVDHTHTLSWIQWTDWQIETMTSPSAIASNLWNYLPQITTLSLDKEVILQGPLMIGTNWQASDDDWAEITGIYQQLTLNDQDYQAVIEVTHTANNQEIQRYYAKDIGWIATWRPKTADSESGQFMALNHLESQVKIDWPIQVAKINEETDGPLLTLEDKPVSWQTNGDLTTVFETLFHEEEWMTDQIHLNTITVGDNEVVVDFTPGIVAAMNQHPAGELSVIPAIVTTLGHHFDVDFVRLTVEGSGLLPDTIEFPPNGQWQVDPDWVSGTSRLEPNVSVIEDQTESESALDEPTTPEIGEESVDLEEVLEDEAPLSDRVN